MLQYKLYQQTLFRNSFNIYRYNINEIVDRKGVGIYGR